MGSSVFGVAVDCANAATLAEFWSRVLGRPVADGATIDTAVEATRIGALNFLEKPIALQKLLKAVQQGLSQGPKTARAPTLRRTNAVVRQSPPRSHNAQPRASPA